MTESWLRARSQFDLISPQSCPSAAHSGSLHDQVNIDAVIDQLVAFLRGGSCLENIESGELARLTRGNRDLLAAAETLARIALKESLKVLGGNVNGSHESFSFGSRFSDCGSTSGDSAPEQDLGERVKSIVLNCSALKRPDIEYQVSRDECLWDLKQYALNQLGLPSGEVEIVDSEGHVIKNAQLLCDMIHSDDGYRLVRRVDLFKFHIKISVSGSPHKSCQLPVTMFTPAGLVLDEAFEVLLRTGTKDGEGEDSKMLWGLWSPVEEEFLSPTSRPFAQWSNSFEYELKPLIPSLSPDARRNQKLHGILGVTEEQLRTASSEADNNRLRAVAAANHSKASAILGLEARSVSSCLHPPQETRPRRGSTNSLAAVSLHQRAGNPKSIFGRKNAGGVVSTGALSGNNDNAASSVCTSDDQSADTPLTASALALPDELARRLVADKGRSAKACEILGVTSVSEFSRPSRSHSNPSESDASDARRIVEAQQQSQPHASRRSSILSRVAGRKLSLGSAAQRRRASEQIRRPGDAALAPPLLHIDKCDSHASSAAMLVQTPSQMLDSPSDEDQHSSATVPGGQLSASTRRGSIEQDGDQVDVDDDDDISSECSDLAPRVNQRETAGKLADFFGVKDKKERVQILQHIGLQKAADSPAPETASTIKVYLDDQTFRCVQINSKSTARDVLTQLRPRLKVIDLSINLGLFVGSTRHGDALRQLEEDELIVVNDGVFFIKNV